MIKDSILFVRSAKTAGVGSGAGDGLGVGVGVRAGVRAGDGVGLFPFTVTFISS